MTANKTAEVLQQHIDKLNQEQTETKWNEKDKKLFEKFLGLVHDDPFRIFYADGGEVHRILELVYPELVKEKIEELYRIKYVYDGFLKYGDIVKPQIEIERPNLETLIKDISDHYLEVYRKQKKVKENVIKQCRSILDKSNKKHYITVEDCSLLLDLADHSTRTMEEKVLLLTEVLENNNVAIQELLKLKIAKKPKSNSQKSKLEESIETPEVIMEAIVPEDPMMDMIEPLEETVETSETKEVDPLQSFYETEVEEIEPEVKESPLENELSVEEEPVLEEEKTELFEEEQETLIETNAESYIELYLHALEAIDPTDVITIQNSLPKSHMPNFLEIMNSLIDALKKQIAQIKEEEQHSELKKIRLLREELGRAQQLLKTITSYLDKNDKLDTETKEKIVEGEEVQLLLLETEDGDCLIEKDFKKQLEESEYQIALDLLQQLEQFSDPAIRSKAKKSKISGILELSKSGVHLFFEPFAENTYIVIALLAEKNGYFSWVEDKLRLRHSLYQKQEKGMQRRWNQHGTRNTMLLGSEAAYLDMQDMAEKR